MTSFLVLMGILSFSASLLGALFQPQTAVNTIVAGFVTMIVCLYASKVLSALRAIRNAVQEIEQNTRKETPKGDEPKQVVAYTSYGSSRPTGWTCKTCGAVNSTTASFCKGCGKDR